MAEPSATATGTTLVIAAHPHLQHSRVNRALLRAAAQTPVMLRDLYALYPDYLIDVAGRAGGARPSSAGRLAAPDPLVQLAATDETVD